MARAKTARALMMLALKTTYATPPVGGFTRMPFNSTSPGAEQPLLTPELLGYDRAAGEGREEGGVNDPRERKDDRGRRLWRVECGEEGFFSYQATTDPATAQIRVKCQQVIASWCSQHLPQRKSPRRLLGKPINRRQKIQSGAHCSDPRCLPRCLRRQVLSDSGGQKPNRLSSCPLISRALAISNRNISKARNW